MKPSSENEIKERLAAAIVAARRRAGLTQMQLSDACGMPRSYVADLEGARRNPSLRNLVRLANALQVPLADLFR